MNVHNYNQLVTGTVVQGCASYYVSRAVITLHAKAVGVSPMLPAFLSGIIYDFRSQGPGTYDFMVRTQGHRRLAIQNHAWGGTVGFSLYSYYCSATQDFGSLCPWCLSPRVPGLVFIACPVRESPAFIKSI